MHDEDRRLDRQEPNRPKIFMGDEYGAKETGMIRLLTQNFNGIAQRNNNINRGSIEKSAFKHEIDIL